MIAGYAKLFNSPYYSLKFFAASDWKNEETRMKKPRKRGRVHRSQQNGVFARVAVVRLIEKEIVETEDVLTSFTRLNKVKILCTSEDGSL